MVINSQTRDKQGEYITTNQTKAQMNILTLLVLFSSFFTSLILIMLTEMAESPQISVAEQKKTPPPPKMQKEEWKTDFLLEKTS